MTKSQIDLIKMIMYNTDCKKAMPKNLKRRYKKYDVYKKKENDSFRKTQCTNRKYKREIQ